MSKAEEANVPSRMTEEQLRAGMLFSGNRVEYGAELDRREAKRVQDLQGQVFRVLNLLDIAELDLPTRSADEIAEHLHYHHPDFRNADEKQLRASVDAWKRHKA